MMYDRKPVPLKHSIGTIMGLVVGFQVAGRNLHPAFWKGHTSPQAIPVCCADGMPPGISPI